MSWPDTPAFRMRYAAAASPPNPPPTICAFIYLTPGLQPPDPSPLKQATERELNQKKQTFSRRRLPPANRGRNLEHARGHLPSHQCVVRISGADAQSATGI